MPLESLAMAFLAGVCTITAINLLRHALSIRPCPYHDDEIKGDCTKCIFRPNPYKNRWS